MSHNKFTRVAAVGTATLLLAACATTASDAAGKRAEIRKMCDNALATLYTAKPELRAEIGKAAGYGCFSSVGFTFLLGGAGGAGLVHDNTTKKDTYMNMGQATIGLEISAKDYREVLVFKNAATMQTFVDKGWEFAGGATAAATASGQGAEAGQTQVTSQSGIDVYPMTQTGLALGVSVGARKYWKDAELNAGM